MANVELGPWAVKIVSWIGSALAGAFLVLLLNSSGDHRDMKNLNTRVDKLEQEYSTLQSTYATNKRVDDLQSEIRGYMQNLDGKFDNVVKLLLTKH